MGFQIQESFTRANGLWFHVARIERDGPLVLFLHGFPDFWYSWRFQLPAVARAGFRAWAPDLRGYNLTEKPVGVHAYHPDVLTLDIVELLNAAGADKAFIVAHDWGAILAWWFAMDYPERVAKLVILNAPHPANYHKIIQIPRQWFRSWYIGFFQLPVIPEFLFHQYAHVIAKGIRQSAVHPDVYSDADVAAYARAIAQPDAMRSAVNYYRALVRWGVWRRLKPIQAPTLMIWGEQDIAIEKALANGTERYVRDFRIHFVPDSGHWVQHEARDQVNRLILEFLGAS
jgi:pimeloyl-ACP methyl ester carboxylesterase